MLRLLDDRALDVMVPSMILQPLVENAIRHGVEKMTDPGRIEIEALLEGETLVLRVSDNGPACAERPVASRAMAWGCGIPSRGSSSCTTGMAGSRSRAGTSSPSPRCACRHARPRRAASGGNGINERCRRLIARRTRRCRCFHRYACSSSTTRRSAASRPRSAARRVRAWSGWARRRTATRR